MDSFCFAIDPAYGIHEKYKSTIFSCEVEISDVKTHLQLAWRTDGVLDYEINAKGEGLTLERQLIHSINATFEGSAIHSPQMGSGKNTRELIDVLFNYQNHYYLVESKAMGVNESGFNKNLQRKQAGTAKQIKKGLKQLEGALKAIQKNEMIKSTSGDLISIPQDSVLHGVVIISEFFPGWNWDKIVEQVYTVYRNTRCMIHVIDLSEFIYILKLSNRPTIHFNQSMIDRFKVFYENGILNIKSINSSLESTF